jgi:endoglycosylceramidase
MKYPLLLLFHVTLLFSYSFAQTPIDIKDQYGRTLILHGQNTGGGAKWSPGHQPWIAESDIDREQKDWGMNCVRYLIFWGAIEPEKDQYDTAYLQQVKKRVEWYTGRHMYVFFDMHQDVYGYGVGDNGAPVWAGSPTRIKNLIPDKWPWWMQNMEPKVVNSFVQFFKYKKRKELQQHYISAWLKVVNLFKGNPYVLGYDLMNEPHGGKILKTLFGNFEGKWLNNFYSRLIPAIRSVDTSRYIFFEPRSFGVNFGMKSHLHQVHDSIVHKLVYAPHLYMTFVDVGKEYKTRDKRDLAKWFEHRGHEVAMHRSALLIGEYGLSPHKKDFDKYLHDIFAEANKRHASWTYWASDPGGWGPLDKDRKPTPILQEMVQVYPQATAGTLVSYTYDQDKRSFDMIYISGATATLPTAIAIPGSIYPAGYDLTVTGGPYKTDTDPKTNALLLYVSEPGARIEVRVENKK